jgi:hypothetical protein
MNNLEVLLGIVVAFFLYAGYRIIQSFQGMILYLRRISKVCTYLYENRSNLSKLSTGLAETLDGANKINQDSVDANVALVNEVIKLRESVDRFVLTVAPPSDPTPTQYSPELLEGRFDNAYRELMDQGMDPEEAKYKAAEYEMDILSRGIGNNLGIGA